MKAVTEKASPGLRRVVGRSLRREKCLRARKNGGHPRVAARLLLSLLLVASLLFGGCFRGEVGEQFYGKASVPSSQEFRWSDGGLPRVFDPARAAAQTPAQAVFGVVALDAHTLRVSLQRPDVNFPALVAHPVFRPVHELSPGVDLPELREEQRQDGGAQGELGIITNGAFSLSRLAADGVELERAPGYWDADSVKLERVRFVDKGDTEASLAAYREGEVDAVTNAAVEPLAVKLLTPYKDFRRETFAALNYYTFNTAHAPFDDRRVREALARALDTERLSADTLGGATEPARGFLPAPPDADDTAAPPGA